MYQDTVTLFNRSGDIWRASVLRNVDLNVDRASILATYGEHSQDSAKLHVRCDGDAVGGFTYVKPDDYSGADGEITFRSGEEFDFFLADEWDGAEVISDNDYVDGFYNHLNSVRDGVFAISSVARYSVIPHFEVMGR